MVCDHKGKLLGELQKVIRAPDAGGGVRPVQDRAYFWVPVPGFEGTTDDIENPELHRLVTNVLNFRPDEGDAFLASLAQAQPQATAQSEHDPRLSILVGRPLALVRASLGIELDGDAYRNADAPLPPENNANDGATRGITKVAFNVRLGGASDTGGGLAGFLLDGDNTYYPRFGITGNDQFAGIKYGKELSIDAASSLNATLLMDPHAAVHARSGILPRHTMKLPEEIAAGLSSIRDVFFQSAPILGPPGAPRLPNPSDDYGQWSWAARPQVTHWQEYPNITDPGTQGGFGPTPQQLQEGWLKLVMNPVSVSAFWVKEGAIKVAANTNVTLGWMTEGANKLVLSESGDPDPVAVFAKEDGKPLPDNLKYQVKQSGTLTLTASDLQGNKSIKTLDFNVQ